ncbi:MAG TPA: energy transducer TonB [Gemmatimonadales bacterium]|nr:energy transducer TonB [Gemmatimonadales bacterium]
MRRARGLVAGCLVAALAAGCRPRSAATVTLPADAAAGSARGDEPPVALDPESPVEYPPTLYQLRISGTVLLRLFVDATGQLVRDSSRVQESSGYPALDSAALAATPRLHYAPALRSGVAIATLFTQPVRFRHPDREGGGTTP